MAAYTGGAKAGPVAAQQHAGRLREVLAGAVVEARWTKGDGRAFDACVAGAQAAGARMLEAWHGQWKPARARVAERERMRERMRTIVGAWHAQARRSAGVPEAEGSEGYLPAWPIGCAADVPTPSRRYTAIVPGSVTAWLIAHARATGAAKIRARAQWAAWAARKASRTGTLPDAGWWHRYEAAVRMGAKALDTGGLSATQAHGKLQEWRETCAELGPPRALPAEWQRSSVIYYKAAKDVDADGRQSDEGVQGRRVRARREWEERGTPLAAAVLAVAAADEVWERQHAREIGGRPAAREHASWREGVLTRRRGTETETWPRRQRRREELPQRATSNKRAGDFRHASREFELQWMGAKARCDRGDNGGREGTPEWVPPDSDEERMEWEADTAFYDG